MITSPVLAGGLGFDEGRLAHVSFVIRAYY